jgi:hypothetical protein
LADLKEFKAYYALAEKLIEELGQDKLAKCARLMALHIADYKQRFGDISSSDLLGLLGVVELSEEQAKLLRDAMQILVGYLASIRDGLDGKQGAVHYL